MLIAAPALHRLCTEFAAPLLAACLRRLQANEACLLSPLYFHQNDAPLTVGVVAEEVAPSRAEGIVDEPFTLILVTLLN